MTKKEIEEKRTKLVKTAWEVPAEYHERILGYMQAAIDLGAKKGSRNGKSRRTV